MAPSSINSTGVSHALAVVGSPVPANETAADCAVDMMKLV